MCVGEGEGEGKEVDVISGGRVSAGCFRLESFKGWDFGEVLGEDLNRIFISLSGVSFQGPDLH